jgi:hypothetical protein
MKSQHRALLGMVTFKAGRVDGGFMVVELEPRSK